MMKIQTDYMQIFDFLKKTGSVELLGTTAKGIGLPEDVLEKVCSANAINLLQMEWLPN